MLENVAEGDDGALSILQDRPAGRNEEGEALRMEGDEYSYRQNLYELRQPGGMEWTYVPYTEFSGYNRPDPAFYGGFHR